MIAQNYENESNLNKNIIEEILQSRFMIKCLDKNNDYKDDEKYNNDDKEIIYDINLWRNYLCVGDQVNVFNNN